MDPSRLSNASLDASPSSSGAAYQLILEHIMAYPGSYEAEPQAIEPQKRQFPKEWTASRTPERTSPSSEYSEVQAANAQFATCLMNQISLLPSQPCSLPPVFVTNFMRKCFPSELHLVDFPQALIGLDYLQDLERRRQREINSAKRRLNVDKEALRTNPSYISTLPPGVASWCQDMQNVQRKAQALYTQIYIGLRRWVIINELSIIPFNKHNALAMLNTLYSIDDCSSPSHGRGITAPTPQLTPSVLQHQRSGFLKFIDAVEARGPSTLKPLMNQGKPKEAMAEDTGWPSVSSALDKYLRITMRTIDEAACIESREDLEMPGITPPRPGGRTPELIPQKRKADSGVSVSAVEKLPTQSRRPSAAASTGASTKGSKHKSSQPSTSSAGATTDAQRHHSARDSSISNASDKNKPLPHPPAGATVFTSATTPGSAVKNFSRLERIALEIRKIKSKRQLASQQHSTDTNGDDKENVPSSNTTAQKRGRRDRSVSNPIVLDSQSQSKSKSPEPSSSAARDGDADDRGRRMRNLRSFGDLKNYTRSLSRSRTRSKSRNGDAGAGKGKGRAEPMDVYDREEMLRQRALFEARNLPEHV